MDDDKPSGEIEKHDGPRDYSREWWTAVLPDAELDNWSFRYKGSSVIYIRPAGEYEWTNQIQLDSEQIKREQVTDEWLLKRAEQWIEDRNDERPGYHVVIEHWLGKNGDQTLHLGEREKSHHQWASDIAPRLVEVMREADNRFSGMEDFGEAHGFWNSDHECPLQDGGERNDECKELELESCREWIEKRLDELKDRESTDFHLNVEDGFVSIKVTYCA
jgi:hypothetical protein